MSIRRQVLPVLLAAIVLPWIGLVQAVPHFHADTQVSQEVLACTASSPISHEVHLHGAGETLTPHPCVACLAGTSRAAAPSPVTPGEVESAPFLWTEQPHDVRSLNHSPLPLLRGPPATL